MNNLQLRNDDSDSSIKKLNEETFISHIRYIGCIYILQAIKQYVSVLYWCAMCIDQCYLAVARPYVGWVEAIIYLSMDKTL